MAILKTRVIPVLLMRKKGLVKTVGFKDPKYVGDPINSIRIFNEKEVDELVLLDIEATVKAKEPDYEMIEDVAAQAFMPMAYGGGIKNIEQIKTVFTLGVEKVVVNSACYDSYDLLQSAADIYGGQSIVASIDVKKTLLGGFELYSRSASKKAGIKLDRHLAALEKSGVGEIIVNSIDRDGKQNGYDLKLLSYVSERVSVPVVACGGASSVDDMAEAVEKGGASAVAAGSLFVFKGKHRAVLINYPERDVLVSKLR